jgi:hypothetical protein
MTANELALFRRMPDVEVARTLGLTLEEARAHRTGANIPQFVEEEIGREEKVDWSKEGF